MDSDPWYYLRHFICCGGIFFLAFFCGGYKLFFFEDRVKNMDAERTG